MNASPTIPDILDAKSINNLRSFLAQYGIGVSGRSYGSANTSIAGGAYVKIEVNHNEWAYGITWDSANYRFVVNSPGVYQVNVAIEFINNTTAETLEIYIYKNGTNVSELFSYKSTLNAGGVSHSDLLTAIKGDYIELYVYHDGGSCTINTGSAQTFISIAKV